MSLITGKPRSNPRYDRFKKLDQMMVKGHWNPSKYEDIIVNRDVPHLKSLNSIDQNLVKSAALNVAAVEDRVKIFWATLPMDIKHKTVSDLCGRHADNEVTHGQAYESLSLALGLKYEDIDNIPVLRDRINYLVSYTSNLETLNYEHNLMRRIVLFTALMERINLFTQFYILMSYNNSKRGLQGIYSLQKTTAVEENIHFMTGLWITEELIHETNDDSFKPELVRALKEGIRHEFALLEWQFRNGEPEHISLEEVKNVALANFTFVAKAFKLDDDTISSFSYDHEMFAEKNMWFLEATELSANPDFFNAPVGGYSFENLNIDIHDFQP